MKKGFTLVELLAVIILLGIIVLVAYPVVNNQIDLARNEAYQRTVESIEEAASRYGAKNILGYETIEQSLPLSTLIAAGELNENDLIDPRNDRKITGCVYYKWNENNKIYEYRFSPNC